jgi:hypothetical protein
MLQISAGPRLHVAAGVMALKAYPRNNRVSNAPVKLCVTPVRTLIIPHCLLSR